MTTTTRRRGKTRRPKARTRKGGGWAAFWNLCTTLTRAWQQGRTATSTRPSRVPGSSGTISRASRPRGGFSSTGSQPDRLLVDLERDNPWLDDGSAGSACEQLDDAHDQADGVDAGEPDGLSVPATAGGRDLGGGAA